MLQQKVRRTAVSKTKLEERLADSKQKALVPEVFSLAMVMVTQNNPGKWSWLTPLGKINVAALW